jgi:hypothetical protein
LREKPVDALQPGERLSQGLTGADN